LPVEFVVMASAEPGDVEGLGIVCVVRLNFGRAADLAGLLRKFTAPDVDAHVASRFALQIVLPRPLTL